MSMHKSAGATLDRVPHAETDDRVAHRPKLNEQRGRTPDGLSTKAQSILSEPTDDLEGTTTQLKQTFSEAVRAQQRRASQGRKLTHREMDAELEGILATFARRVVALPDINARVECTNQCIAVLTKFRYNGPASLAGLAEQLDQIWQTVRKDHERSTRLGKWHSAEATRHYLATMSDRVRTPRATACRHARDVVAFEQTYAVRFDTQVPRGIVPGGRYLSLQTLAASGISGRINAARLSMQVRQGLATALRVGRTVLLDPDEARKLVTYGQERLHAAHPGRGNRPGGTTSSDSP